MIHASAAIKDPDSVAMTLKVTMTVGEWRSLLLKLNESGWPAFGFGQAVKAAIRHATEHFDSSAEYVRE